MTLDITLRHRFADLALDIAFQAPEGVTVLFGRSGAGKTTAINAVAGLFRPDQGRISVAGRTLQDSAAGVFLPPHQRRLGYVFQEPRLFPHMSVQKNLTYGQGNAPPGGAGLGEITELLGLQALLHRRPHDLSGGEKQRVAIGRALLSHPVALLMDEPLSNLDAARKAEILPYIEHLRDALRLPILYVSHSLDEVVRLATTLVLIDAGQVVRFGPAQTVMADPAVAAALGPGEAGALLFARVVGPEPDGLVRVETAGGRMLLQAAPTTPGARLRLRVAARDVILSRTAPQGLSALNVLTGTVADLRAVDATSVLVRLRLGDDWLLAQVTQRSVAALSLTPGAEVHAIVKSVAVLSAALA